MKNKLFLFFFFLLPFVSRTQSTDEQLANYYYSNGDCEKALGYFESIFQEQPSKALFNKYLDCTKTLLGEKAELKLIKSQIDAFPEEYEYQVLLGQTYEKYGDQNDAEKTYNRLIENMLPRSKDIINIQRAFSKMGKYELALKALEHGQKIIKGNYPLNIQFAEVYGDLGETEKMINEYLGLIDYSSSYLSSLQRLMPRMIDFESENSEAYEMLKTNLIKRVQKNPNELAYADMLIWMFVQRQDFASALIHAKALDKRTSQDGKEVFNVGRMSSSSKDYPTARKAYKYVVELGDDLPYYYAAEQLLLNTRFLEVTTQRNYSQEALLETITEYQQALSRIGKRGKALPIVTELAYIQAFYADQPTEAKQLIEEAMDYPGATDIAKAELKMLLADILVVLDDIWEASLLYMQIEKEFKYEPIGFEAKYKNARVFYYDGDFTWAQSQLDILKESTSKLIANDAMKLSIFITDNLGLDSNLRAMRQFAKADLLLAQHKYDLAFSLLDSIKMVFPYHGLADEILMRKAEAYQAKGNWTKAIEQLEIVLEKHKEDIHADDALFQLASIYEEHLYDLEKARALYFQLLKEFKGSLYVTEARKRFRNLQDEL
jgi:tetratricopeptide (TPR) repeat protein